MRNFKRWTIIVLACCIVVGVNQILTYLLYPYTYTRADMHHMITQEYDDLLVGTSHGKCGLDPQALEEVTGRKALNVCQGGQYPVDACYMVKEAARHGTFSRVIYELDQGYWVTQPNQSADYITFYHEMPWSPVKAEYFLDKILKADLRTALFPWYFYRKEIFRIGALMEQKKSDVYKNYGTEPFDSQLQTYREDGFMERHRLESDKQEEDVPALWEDSGPRQDAMEAFDKMAAFCKKEGIELVVVITPIPKVTYDKYQEHYDAAEAFLESYMKEREICFFSYMHSDDAEIPRSLEEFADYDGHMYEDAAARFSRIFGEALNMTNT